MLPLRVACFGAEQAWIGAFCQRIATLNFVDDQDIEDADDNLDVTWPWPRAMYGYIAAYCKTAGAKVVVFDWLFQDRGQYSVGDAEEFAQAMRDAGNVVIGLALTRDPLVARPRSVSQCPAQSSWLPMSTKPEAMKRLP